MSARMVSDHTVVDSGSLRGVGTARQVNVSVSRVAWSACRTLRYDEWCRQGAHLSVAELASLDPEQQERWLDRAVAERLSIKALRQRLSAQRHDAHAGRAGDLPETRTLVFRTPPGATAVRERPRSPAPL